MQIIDFSRSFLWWRIDTTKKPPKTMTNKPPFSLNNARVPLDCLCTIRERMGRARVFSFALGVSCKVESVGAEKDIWPAVSADFKPVMSDTHMLGIKTYEIFGKEIPLHPPELGMQPERQISRMEDVFDSARVDLTRVQGRNLSTHEAITAILNNRVLTGRTEYRNHRYDIVLEYPIKTVNANERDGFYQPDTGPVLWPDVERDAADLLAGMELAYLAFNRSDWVEALVRVPVPVAHDVEVYHYDRAVRVLCENDLQTAEQS
ncbi:MAG: hypothetical protein VX733_12055 [Candidatus Latescibacterota bacterium]|nr:hypothetical protein [Candidatus Latescibacterota bacterium]